MLVEFLHFVTSRAEVFAGVEFTGLVVEHLAHCGSHSQTGVRVDIDFANSALGSLAEFLLGDTDSVGKFAAVFVNHLNVFLGN